MIAAIHIDLGKKECGLTEASPHFREEGYATNNRVNQQLRDEFNQLRSKRKCGILPRGKMSLDLV